jgi:hypothetical protein
MPPSTSTGPDRPTVFVSYSHLDETWKDLVVGHLKVLGSDLEVWDDRRIMATASAFTAPVRLAELRQRIASVVPLPLRSSG